VDSGRVQSSPGRKLSPGGDLSLQGFQTRNEKMLSHSRRINPLAKGGGGGRVERKQVVERERKRKKKR